MEAIQQIGKYKLQHVLGRGATAEVWKAFDQTLQREVAIKFLLPSQTHNVEFAERFQREIKAIVSLEHPNIVQIYDISANSPDKETTQERYDTYIVMQYIAGPTLAKYIAQTSQNGKFPSKAEILRLFTALGSAIDYAHQRGMIHRDIKPMNILLDQQPGNRLPGNSILTDFGLVKFLDFAAAHWQSTTTVLGTPHYIAPEQALGLEVTPRSDLYALGVILYEVCTGKLPYDFPEQSTEQSVLTIFMQQVMFAPIPPSYIRPDISPELEAVILKSIAKEPDERYPDAASMCHALRRALTPFSPNLHLLLHKHATQQRKARPDSQSRYNTSPLSRSSMKAERQRSKSKIRAQQQQQYQQQQAAEVALPSTAHPSPRSARSLKITAFTLVSLLLIALMLFFALKVHRPASSGQTAARPVGGALPSGHLLFLSTGLGDATHNQGVNDIVQVDLTALTAPYGGKHYYAWLEGDDQHGNTPALLLGTLTVTLGQAHLRYIQPQHSNLLMTMSRFLVTAENASTPPAQPSGDASTWYIVGSIVQTPNPDDRDHYSLRDHLRHLLAADPELTKLGLEGGLTTWLQSNAQTVEQLAQQAAQSGTEKKSMDAHNQLARLRAYLEGSNQVTEDTLHSPAARVDSPAARIGLLQIHAYQDPPSYLYHIDTHLMALVHSPGATAEQQKIAISINRELNSIQIVLQQVFAMTRDLVALPLNQLLQPDSQRQFASLVHLTTAIYDGSDTTHPGIHTVCHQMFALTTMPLSLYRA